MAAAPPDDARAVPAFDEAEEFVARRGTPWDFVRRHPMAAAGGALLALMILIAIFAPYLGTVDPLALNPVRRMRPPSAEMWFGTDTVGRDLYSRVLYGTRVSLAIGVAVALAAIVIGLIIGLIAGYIRWLDGPIMRIMDGLMAIPPILLAIALMALTRASIENVVVAITIAEVPRVSRLVRSVVLTLREQPFIEAARATGTRSWRILTLHILPNTTAPLMVQATYVCASAIIIEAVLSFLGAGTPPDIPSWGNIVAEGRNLFLVAPYIIIIPGLFLSVTVLAVNLLGDGLRDALDPRLARKL
ncbi:MAG: ABC transporter permease [Candidatus Eiseniibacteriota bacterium]